MQCKPHIGNTCIRSVAIVHVVITYDLKSKEVGLNVKGHGANRHTLLFS